MRFQNRVNPEGEICFASERGTLMGNRGCLHDDTQKIRYTSKRDAWVTCLLSFKERNRELMQPGQYTELFFLDEATALAAGHRPCAECRRERYKQFLAAWPSQGNGVRAADIDRVLKVNAQRMFGRLPASWCTSRMERWSKKCRGSVNTFFFSGNGHYLGPLEGMEPLCRSPAWVATSGF